MNPQKEIRYIEFTLKKIFEQDKISKYDIIIANKLFYKWKKLTEHKEEEEEHPLIDDILDEEPDWKNKKND